MLFVHGWQSMNKQFKENRMSGLAVQQKNNVYEIILCVSNSVSSPIHGTAFYRIAYRFKILKKAKAFFLKKLFIELHRHTLKN